MAEDNESSPQGLPWPEAYAALLPAIREQWKVSGEMRWLLKGDVRTLFDPASGSPLSSVDAVALSANSDYA